MTAATVDRGLLTLAVALILVLAVVLAGISLYFVLSHYMAGGSYHGRHDRDRLDAFTRIKNMADYPPQYGTPPHPDGDPAPLHREGRRR